MVKILAVDVCGTLYDENTTSGFIIFHHRRKNNNFRAWFLYLISGRRKIIPYVLSRIGSLVAFDIHRYLALKTLRGETKESLKISAESYLDELDELRIEKVHGLVRSMRSDGWSPILVSNSIDVVIRVVAERLQLEFVASELLWSGNRCEGSLAIDLTGKKRWFLEQHLGISVLNDHFSIVTDNKSDADLISVAKPVYLVANGKAKSWMEKYDAEFINY